MQENIKNAVEKYQCPGCVCGSDISCFEAMSYSKGCGRHVAGTLLMPHIGKIFLGMPKGFNRIGKGEATIRIFEEYEDNYNVWNVAVWKYLSKDNHTFVRTLCPRTNTAFVDVFLKNCIDKIECLDVTNLEMD